MARQTNSLYGYYELREAISFGADLHTRPLHVLCLVHHQAGRNVELELSQNSGTGALHRCVSERQGSQSVPTPQSVGLSHSCVVVVLSGVPKVRGSDGVN